MDRDRMPPLNYRWIIYAGTLLTGMTGLIYQVVWQKYLSFIVGSEARSVALVVAVFLAGLAAGYRFWGKFSERSDSRRKLLRLYGAIEMGIGVYAALFPFYLELLRLIAYNGPAGLLIDLLVTVLTLLIPTFLMGSTIPLLVSVVPERADEIHLCHAKIYGINTLGACLGAFGASFALIPKIGLDGSLLLAAAVNLVVGGVFLANRLTREVIQEETVEAIPNPYDPRIVYFYVLVTGTVTLSLEVLFVRVLGLTVGTGPHNFAIIVGVFIFGLATGSLSITGRRLTVGFLVRAVSFLLLYLMVLFHTVPYWPYWLNNIRVSMRSIPTNYPVFLGIVTVFLFLAMLPFLIPLGTMLPLAYGLIPKNTADYGKKCGWMYFYNTLGTAIGAVALSYLLLHVMELDQVFKLDVALMAALAVYLVYKDGRQWLATFLGLATLIFVFGPGWDRSAHYVGLFRFQEINSYNFTGVFRKPQIAPKVEFFKDGPDATVTVVEYPRAPQVYSRSLVINGKSDGDTILDYSTINLATMLPYLYAADRNDLEAAVIGMGTGVTAGLMGRGEDIAKVTNVEIASTLVESAPMFNAQNHDLLGNPKVELVATDGFKYFSRLKGELDIVVSATSPPWVMGVENLFTPQFYELAHGAMSEDGVFLQWFPLYTMDVSLLRSILNNIGGVFPHLRLYRISTSEMGILAAKQPMLDDPVVRRFNEPTLRAARERMELHFLGQLSLIALYETDELRFFIEQGPYASHTLRGPSLAYASDRLRFVDPLIEWDNFTDPRLSRMTRYTEARGAAFLRLLAEYPNGLRCKEPTTGPQLFCERYNRLLEARRTTEQDPSAVPLQNLLQAYDLLRQEGVVAPDGPFISRIAAYVYERYAGDAPSATQAAQPLLLTCAKDGLWDEASAILDGLLQRGLIGQDYHGTMVGELQRGRLTREQYANSLP